MTTETVKGLDFSGRTSTDVIRDQFGDALVRLVMGTQPHWRTSAPQAVVWAVFDSRKLRNTEAHGIVYRAGWTCHVEVGDTAPTSGPGFVTYAPRPPLAVGHRGLR